MLLYIMASSIQGRLRCRGPMFGFDGWTGRLGCSRPPFVRDTGGLFCRN